MGIIIVLSTIPVLVIFHIPNGLCSTIAGSMFYASYNALNLAVSR